VFVVLTSGYGGRVDWRFSVDFLEAGWAIFKVDPNKVYLYGGFVVQNKV
jgi:hypothetical protein